MKLSESFPLNLPPTSIVSNDMPALLQSHITFLTLAEDLLQ
ncbi:hypothetical protein N8Z28_00150 [bacterium]|nr:hypothetical protein [bacterium]